MENYHKCTPHSEKSKSIMENTPDSKESRVSPEGTKQNIIMNINTKLTDQNKPHTHLKKTATREINNHKNTKNIIVNRDYLLKKHMYPRILYKNTLVLGDPDDYIDFNVGTPVSIPIYY
jgi:hypothetical protein